MNYYSIKGPKGPVAVVFHDYLSLQYVINSKSESFRIAFESAVKSVGDVAFKKVKNVLKVSKFGPGYVGWLPAVVDKVCGDYWIVDDSGEVYGDVYSEDIAKSYLS